MNKMQEHLIRAGNDLGIRVIAPVQLRLDSGRSLAAEALLPDLGHPKGTIVSQSSDDFLAIVDELKRMGYGYSVFDEPLPNEDYDVEFYIEMFAEWGWAAEDSRMPSWMAEQKASGLDKMDGPPCSQRPQ